MPDTPGGTHRSLVATAPLRIDLAGGTLDIWPLYLLVEAAVTVNAAIDIYARCRLEPGRDRRVEIRSRDRRVSARFSSPARVRSRRGLELVAELAAHLRPEAGFRLETDCSAPAGSGLGGSSALAIAVAAVLGRFSGRRLGGADLVRLCRDLEARVIRASTGTQDYLAALSGGWNAVHYGPGGYSLERLEVPPTLPVGRMMLWFTGRSRPSAAGNRDMLRRCLEGERGARMALAGIARAANGMRRALLRGDWEAVEECLREEWRWRRRLSPEVGRGGVEELIQAARRGGAAAGKPCGAGGGGCVLLLGREERQEGLKAVLKAQGARLLPFRVVRRGLALKCLDARGPAPV
ncbi:MAG: hypothetical protein HY509_03610 [Acidobacteria bacterium]|nr:hypothetical protein [Acidobacteriota bacterium]